MSRGRELLATPSQPVQRTSELSFQYLPVVSSQVSSPYPSFLPVEFQSPIDKRFMPPQTKKVIFTPLDKESLFPYDFGVN